MTSHIAATSKRPVKGRAAFACAIYARGRYLFAMQLTSVTQPVSSGLANEDQAHPGGGSA